MEIVLYHTTGCHLCELAEAELALAGIVAAKVDIATDDVLFQKYGWLIPVVALDEHELRWPFNAQQLSEWLAQIPTRTASTSHDAP